MSEIHQEEKLAELEALLFIYGEPMTIQKIAAALEVPEATAEALVGDLEKRLEGNGRGLALVVSGTRIQLATKPAFGHLIARFMKEELSEELTPASLEALTLIAYFGPISRSRLEYLRGVNSSFILRSLMIRGLVESSPDPRDPQNFFYEPSIEFLKFLGIRKREDLPEYEKFRAFLTAFESQESPQT